MTEAVPEPIVRPAAQAQCLRDPEPEGMKAPASPKILVVNDDPVQLHLASGLLERDGMRVVGCLGAAEALRVLGQDRDFAAVVTDLHMPEIDGWRFCRLLRSPEYAAFNHIPILVVSATYYGADAEQITADLGANAFLPAPYDAGTLRSCMRKLLEGEAAPATRRVLIVGEPTEPIRALEAAFRGYGCRVQLAATADEGLRRYEAEVPEVAVLDYDVPGMRDHRLLQAIKAPGSSTAAVVLTGDPDPAGAAESMQEGADAHVRKPFDPEYVITLCEKARRERALLRVEELLEERTVRLRDSEARFRSLVEGIIEIILVCDQQGMIQYVNEVGAQQLEWQADELIGKPLSTILPGDGVGFAQAVSLSEGEHPCVETTYRMRTGRLIDVEVSQRLIVFDGKPAVMTVARDIIERKRAEEEKARLEDQLRQSQKMEAIGTLAGGVAHDFNNLLTVILGHVELLKMRLHPSDPASEDAITIENVVSRAKALTEQLLGFARRGKHQNIVVDVRNTIREVVTFLGRTLDKKIQLREEFGPEPATLLGDPGQLHQVILNLSVNARDAMPQGGMLVYRTAVVRADDRLRRKFPDLTADRYVMLAVEDSGCGIPEEIKGRIFEPFFTTKDSLSGTGMGLAMVYGIVHNHAGAIEVESLVGMGTTFRLYFPLVARASIQEAPAQDAPVSGVGTVLLVEDEELVRNVAAKLLTHLGYQVATAADGRQAVEYYQVHRDEIGLVILDMIMPRMNGRDCFRALRAINPSVKAILVTGYDQNYSAQELLDEGVQGFVQKPYDIREFSKVVARAINAPPEPRLASSR